MMSFTKTARTPYHSVMALLLIFSMSAAPAAADEMWEDLFQERIDEAEGGEPDAQYEVGIMYLKGQGVQQDRAKAASWLEKASKSGHAQAGRKLRRVKEQEDKFRKLEQQAESGDVKAQYEVGMMYLKGRGVEQNGKLARKWLSRAAEQNDEKATTRLGILYYKGEGGKTDYQAAFKLFNRFNESSPLAQYYLGGMYAHGEGVTKNYQTAIAWYRKAADGGFDMARGNIINLEEEIKMQERRRINSAKTPPEPGKTKVKKKTPVEKKTAKTTVKAVPQKKPVKKKAPAKKSTAIPVLDRLAAKNWKRNNKPVEYLPSKITKCEKDRQELVCFSDVLKRMSGTQSVQYRVKSVISSQRGLVKVSYKNLVIEVENTEDADDQPLSYDDETEQGFAIRTGWTKEHTVECKQPRGKAMECMKNRMHAIAVVED